MLESQIAYLRQAVRLLRGGGALEVREDVMRAFNDRLQRPLAGPAPAACGSRNTSDARARSRRGGANCCNRLKEPGG